MAVGAKLRYEVLRRDNYTCQFCGASAPDVYLAVDHVRPRKHDGDDVASNLQVLCVSCNAGKSATMPERWLVRRIEKKQKNWERAGKWHDGEVDDYTEMFAYLDARFVLESLSAEDALHCITHVMADVFPYRPDAHELVVAAARFAAERYVPAPSEVSA